MKKRILALLFLILALTLCACSNNEISTDTSSSTDTASDTEIIEEIKSLVELTVDKNESFVGKISFNIKADGVFGEYSLEFADKNGEALPHYSKISNGSLTKEKSTIEIEGLVLPSACEKLALSINEEKYSLEIPNEYLVGVDTYRFGALSDVHYNKGNYFNLALDFLDKAGIDFVGVCGDLSSSGELESLQKFNEAIKERKYKVYTVSGNHDTPALDNGSWKENINTSIINDNEVVEIAENGIDFVYKPKAMGGAFVFLSQTRWSYPSIVDPSEYTLLDKEQLDWLRAILEKNKEEPVFLFFHTLLADTNGLSAEAVGNLKNPGGYEYPLDYTYGAADEVEFRALMNEYKNVVFFSGHSHWMFEMEAFNKNANFSNFGGEYCHMDHIPSVCEPRWIDISDEERTSKTGEASEGWIVDVSSEAIIFTPVDFIKEIYYTEYMEIIPLQ